MNSNLAIYIAICGHSCLSMVWHNRCVPPGVSWAFRDLTSWHYIYGMHFNGSTYTYTIMDTPATSPLIPKARQHIYSWRREYFTATRATVGPTPPPRSSATYALMLISACPRYFACCNLPPRSSKRSAIFIPSHSNRDEIYSTQCQSCSACVSAY